MYYKVGWWYVYSERSYTEHYVYGTEEQAIAYREQKLEESPEWMKKQVGDHDKFIYPIEVKIY